MLDRKLLPNFETQVAGKENFLFLNEGQNVGVIWLEVGDDNGTLLKDLIDEILFYLFNEGQWTFTAEQYQKILSLRGPKHGIQTSGDPGTAAYRTYIPLWLDKPWVEPRREGNLGLNLIGGCEPKIGVSVKSGISNPVLQGWYYYRPLNGGIGLMTKFKRQPVQVSGVKNAHVNLEKKDLIQSIHLFPPDNGGYVNEVSLSLNNRTRIDQITHLQNQASLIGRGLSPDTTATPRYDILMDEEDPQDIGLPTGGAQEMTLTTKYSTTVTGTMDIILETIGAPESAPK
jgi:hypothetical protein